MKPIKFNKLHSYIRAKKVDPLNAETLNFANGTV